MSSHAMATLNGQLLHFCFATPFFREPENYGMEKNTFFIPNGRGNSIILAET